MSFLSLLGLPIGFVILAALLLWLLVDKKIRLWFKLALISVVIWFGLVMWSVPGNILGWPKYVPDKYHLPPCIILSYKIIDPVLNPKESGIYLWIVPKDNAKLTERPFSPIDPRKVLFLTFEDSPRAYKLEYSVEEADNLRKANEEASEMGGIVRFIPPDQRQRGPDGSRRADHPGDEEDDTGWRAVDPRKILEKVEE